MSAAAMFWALKSPVETPEERLVLLMLANYVDCGGCCGAAPSWMATQCCITVERYFEIIASLQQRGLVKRFSDADGEEVMLFFKEGWK